MSSPGRHAVALDGVAISRLRRIGGDDFVIRMIDLYLESTPARLRAAIDGERTGDLESVRRAAHSLKSTAGNLGAHRVQALALELEIMAQRSESEGLRRSLDQLERALSDAGQQLMKERNNQ